jgi:hypothetical protein
MGDAEGDMVDGEDMVEAGDGIIFLADFLVA